LLDDECLIMMVEVLTTDIVTVHITSPNDFT